MVKESLYPIVLRGACHCLEFSSLDCPESTALCWVQDQLGFCEPSWFFTLLGQKQPSPGAPHNIGERKTPRLIFFCFLLFASFCLVSKSYVSGIFWDVDARPYHFLCQECLGLSWPFAFIFVVALFLFFKFTLQFKSKYFKRLFNEGNTPCSFSLLWAPFPEGNMLNMLNFWMVISRFFSFR